MVKPYYQEEGITIYRGDCRDILPHLEPVDLVLTDPPYGIGGGRGGDSRKYAKGKYCSEMWDDTPDYIKDVVAPVIAELIKTSKRVIITPGHRNMHNYKPPDDVGCFWTPASCTHGPWGATTFHPIFYYGKDQRGGINPLPSGKQITERTVKYGHPCAKPIMAWLWLLNKGSAKTTDTILDPFMGSGTTLVAAQQLGRKAIGIEIELKYVKIAIKRLEQGCLDFSNSRDSEGAQYHEKSSPSSGDKMRTKQLNLIDGEHQ